MKKLLFILSLAAVSLSSCLKDKPNTDFSSIGTVVELPYAGIQYFSMDAITDAGPAITRSFGINIASDYPLKTDTKYTVAVDNTMITSTSTAVAALTGSTAIAYQPMPDGSFTLSKTSGTIKAGARLDSVTVTFDKSKLDPTLSYMLPVKLASASNGILSGNFNAHFYHFIGNDFAGTYTQNFQRYNAADSTSTALNSASFTGTSVILSPVSPTEFTAPSGYATGALVYDITFTKTGTGPTATYSNFTVSFTAASIASASSVSGISVVNSPVFFVNGKPAGATLAGPYTYAQAVKLFHFQAVAATTGPRYLIDTYYK
jgi:hypothetical protein